jgi:hypothetical protein
MKRAPRDAFRIRIASREAFVTDRRVIRSVGRGVASVDFCIDSRFRSRFDRRVGSSLDRRVDLCVRSSLDRRVGSGLDRRVRSGLDRRVRSSLDRRVDLRVRSSLDGRIRAGVRACRTANSTSRAADSTGRAANSTGRAANSTTGPTCRSCGSARTIVCGYFIVATARRDRTGDEDERQTGKNLRHALHIHAPVDWT